MTVNEHCYGVIPLRKEENWQVLLVHHTKGSYWSFPKGHSDPYESPQQTAMRECEEETGYEVIKFLDDMTFEEQYEFERDHQKISKKVSYFPALVRAKTDSNSSEVIAIEWINIDQASQKITFDASKNTLYEVTQWIEKTFPNNSK